jgi:pimeloyl-ACP methyl ester carboxylesterase
MDLSGVKFVRPRNGTIELNVGVAGQGPLILCVHGFPELWCSWRHQSARHRISDLPSIREFDQLYDFSILEHQ